jgi:hypothetical protein
VVLPSHAEESLETGASHGERLAFARIGTALFLVSFGVLTVEVCLTRVFSFAISYHFAYLTIATAMLGFGSAGSLLAAFPSLGGSVDRRLVGASVLAALAVVATLAFSAVARFDPTFIGSSARALGMLALYYAVVLVPFLLAGVAIATVLSEYPRNVGRLYAVDLGGAALGCAASVPMIWLIQTPAAVLVGALALALGGVVFAGPNPRLRRTALTGLAGTFVLGALTIAFGPFPPSPGRFLANYLAMPGVHHLFAQWTPLSRVDAVGWERSENSWKGSYATAGVSPRFVGRGPEYRMVGYDGGSFAVMYEYRPGETDLDVFRHHVMATPYHLLEHPETLIIGLGGGADALAGVANGAGPMTGVELNPVTVKLGMETFRDFNGGLFHADNLTVVNAEARHYAEANAVRRFDLVVLNSIDTLSALSSGAYVLAESYLYTREAFTHYLELLKPQGIYALYAFDNFGLAGPTFIILRFASTIHAALAALGVADPKQHVVVLAGPGETPLVATLVKRTPFMPDELQALDAFAGSEGFTFWHRPDRIVDHQVGRFFWMTPDERARLLDAHYLQLQPATDDTPFFFNFYKWKTLIFPRADDAHTTPSTGQRMLLVMLIQAIAIAAVMILGPLFWIERAHRRRRSLALTVYFAALGFGFIFLEVSLMQRFVLFLGFPTYSLSVVLFTLLLSTGAGSALSSRFAARPTHAVLASATLLTVVVLALLFALPPVFNALLDRSLAVRIAVSVIGLFPWGFCLACFSRSAFDWWSASIAGWFRGRGRSTGAPASSARSSRRCSG